MNQQFTPITPPIRKESISMIDSTNNQRPKIAFSNAMIIPPVRKESINNTFTLKRGKGIVHTINRGKGLVPNDDNTRRDENDTTSQSMSIQFSPQPSMILVEDDSMEVETPKMNNRKLRVCSRILKREQFAPLQDLFHNNLENNEIVLNRGFVDREHSNEFHVTIPGY